MPRIGRHFRAYRHFVDSFHDFTLECIAESRTIQLGSGPLTELISAAARSLA